MYSNATDNSEGFGPLLLLLEAESLLCVVMLAKVRSCHDSHRPLLSDREFGELVAFLQV